MFVLKLSGIQKLYNSVFVCLGCLARRRSAGSRGFVASEGMSSSVRWMRITFRYNLYFRLRFGLVGLINTYLKIEIRLYLGEILALNAYQLNSP